MDKQNTEHGTSSSPCWETLESWARAQIQTWVQDLLEAEVTELLGRGKSQRRQVVDAPPGSRNGYGKARRLTVSAGWRPGSRAGSCHYSCAGRRP